MKNNETPVLIIAFNRPETLVKILSVVRKIKSKRIYFACDAARIEKDTEVKAVEQVHATIENEIDWECEIFKLYQTENQGCRLGVVKAIDWFFSNEEMGIILEDDCLPSEDFFSFCSELLVKYQYDNRIMTVSGDRSPLTDSTDFSGYSYGFSKIPLIWGWASWRRAWKTYDLSLSTWPIVREAGWLKGFYRDEDTYNWLYDCFENFYTGRSTSTWDFQWAYNCLTNSGLSIIPSKNLISNIGFGIGATHPSILESPRNSCPTEALSFPLAHPTTINTWENIDKKLIFNGLGVKKKFWLRKLLKKLLPSKSGRKRYDDI